MNVMPETAAGKYDYKGKTYYFCAQRCLERFRANPDQFLEGRGSGPPVPLVTLGTFGTEGPPPSSPSAQTYTCPMHPEVRQSGPGACPKCGMALEPEVISL